jgi:F-type H+-transporting ATPase subunit epsilon
MYRKGEQRRYLSIFWGYMEVNNDKVTILAEVAEPAAEIDRPRVEAARERAEQRLRRFEDQTIDRERARAALERAIVRLGVLSKAH